MRGGWRRPEVLLPVTFLAAITIGTILLDLPGMSSDRVGLLEAFFTSVSAVCVTGLVVVDTGRDFTPAGQAVIAGLIQVGGLGIMTFGVLALLLAGRRVSFRHESALRSTFTAVASWRIGRLLGGVLLATLLIEGVGFAVLYVSLDDAWSAAFHAISAFCNAGFSLYPDSLQQRGPAVVLTVLGLLVLGGFGFTILIELARAVLPRGSRARRFSLHTRLALFTTLCLWVAGALLLVVTEGGQVGDAFFMSASARTAGFDTTPVGQLSRSALFVLIPLMFIGASPGSTGGGIKTTTFALAVLAARANLRGHQNVVTRGREIPRDAVARMFAIVICSAGVIFIAILLLDFFEGGRGMDSLALFFEAVSAFGTVGLSTGITPSLTAASKLVLCAAMFIGRVGSLSLFLAFVREAPPSHVRYPEERILVG